MNCIGVPLFIGSLASSLDGAFLLLEILLFEKRNHITLVFITILLNKYHSQ